MHHATLFQFIWIFMINTSTAEVFNSIQHKSVIACGGNMRLNCSSTNDILRIIGASYGRFTSFLCHPNSWPTPSSQWDLQCSAGGSFSIASERCDGKPSCTIEQSTTLFGDPCRTTPKYLQVLYRCVEQTGPLKHNPQIPTTLSYPATLIHKTTSSMVTMFTTPMVTEITTPMKTERTSPMFPGSSEIVSIAERCDEDKSNFSISGK
ncbi:L-rhamnose-binding lectin CSL1-like [Mytilus galloprovincialis]|uniref:L-rhamnose-binding lectin CSL1-like n=1 Tax=Mytilus galloprovincialis TaxID=29158 RepID=UPI003F7B99C2